MTAEMSSDRLGFLRSISRSPGDDTTRLAYADWLQENGSGDLDAATAEFIQAGCRLGGSQSLMAKGGYDWLDANWPRLIPSVMALHAGFSDDVGPRSPRIRLRLRESRWPRRYLPGSEIPFQRHGRIVCFGGVRAARKTAADVSENEYVPAPGWQRPFWAQVEFWKGFAVDVKMWGIRVDRFDNDGPLSGIERMYKDQPFLRVR